ncbi:hypothetical protein, partial [Porticoccus sp.]
YLDVVVHNAFDSDKYFHEIPFENGRLALKGRNNAALTEANQGKPPLLWQSKTDSRVLTAESQFCMAPQGYNG